MFGHVTYIAITALIVNLAVAAVLTVVFRRFGLRDGYDETKPGDYTFDPVPAPARPSAAPGPTPAREPVTPRSGLERPRSVVTYGPEMYLYLSNLDITGAAHAASVGSFLRSEA